MIGRGFVTQAIYNLDASEVHEVKIPHLKNLYSTHNCICDSHPM